MIFWSHFKVDQKLLFYNLGTWFQNVYGNNPMELVRMVKKVLSVEQMIIQNATQAQTGKPHHKPGVHFKLLYFPNYYTIIR